MLFFNYQIKTMEASNSLLCVNKHYKQYTSKLLAISKPLSQNKLKRTRMLTFIA